MGYYRSEYEEYYRDIKRNVGRSSYSRNRGYDESSYNRGISNRGYMDTRRNRREFRRNKSKSTGEHIYDFLKIIGIQALAIGGIGILIYSCGIAKEREFKKLNKTIVEVIKTDYYFNEDKIVEGLKEKIFKEINVIEGIDGE